VNSRDGATTAKQIAIGIRVRSMTKRSLMGVESLLNPASGYSSDIGCMEKGMVPSLRLPLKVKLFPECIDKTNSME